MNSKYKQKGPRLNKYFWLIIVLPVLSGCKKFLDQKPIVSQVVPHTPNDLQTLLDNTSEVNYQSPTGYAELIADDYFFRSSDWLSLYNNGNPWALNYIWEQDAMSAVIQWWGLGGKGPYEGPIYYSNVVLDNLPKISWELKDSSWVNAIKGSALFYRAFAFYNLAQVFCRPYDQQYLSGLGNLLRLTSDASIIDHHRSTLAETYDKILDDLTEAASLLPVNTSFPTRPCQAAAYAALARVYLSMRDYVNSGKYANLALQQKFTLLDYNTKLPVVNNAPFPIFNPEVIFDDFSPPFVYFLQNGDARIDTLLYRSYDNNDLRKTLFFFPRADRGSDNYFRGSYNSKANNNSPDGIFDGLATDELYLIRAECSARVGNKDSAMNDLNKLLIKRWSNAVTYPVITATDAADALAKILVERRKELIWRGQRWMDVRRLNLEGYNITLKRNINGTLYTLPPNDLRSVMQIPNAEIVKTGIDQNPR